MKGTSKDMEESQRERWQEASTGEKGQRTFKKDDDIVWPQCKPL